MPTKEQALPGRTERMDVPDAHHVNGARLDAAVSCRAGARDVRDGMFLGRREDVLAAARRLLDCRRLCRRFTPNPTYREVCSGMTGHNEVVLVVFDPKKISLRRAAQDVLGESRPDAGHAAGERRRHPVSLRDLLLRRRAARGRGRVPRRLSAASSRSAGYGAITTEILPAPEFYYAEDYHQQYLSKNPDGYCGLGGTGVTCPVGVAAAHESFAGRWSS